MRYRPQTLELRKYYVYEHIRPDTGLVFYVGKGCHERAEDTQRRNNEWYRNVVAKLARCGLYVEVVIVYDKLLESRAFELEIERIAYWRSKGVVLCNLTDGGEGLPGLFRTDDHRSNISAALTGRKLSPEHVEKLRRASLGRKQTPEEIERRRLANVNRPRTEEMKRKMSAAHTVEQLTRRAQTVIANTASATRALTGTNKKCISCGHIRDTSCFTKRAHSFDGLHCYCRDCKNKKSRAQKAPSNKFGVNYSDPTDATVRRNGSKHLVPTGKLKTCLTCGLAKDTVHFSNRSASPDGLNFHCRDCRAAAWAVKRLGG